MTITPERGTKCTCVKCATRFYDMNKNPGICPKCGQQVAPPPKAATRRSRRGSTTPRQEPALEA